MEPSERTIWPYPPALTPAKLPTWREAAISMLIVSFTAAILWPVYSYQGEHAGPPRCASNVRQSSVGVLMYAQDYDDHLPTSKWMDASYPYTKNWTAYACTQVRESNTEEFGLSFNQDLAGKPAIKTAATENRVLIYDSSLLYKNAAAPLRTGLMKPGRHRGKNNIEFLDGHLRCLSVGELSALYH